MTTHEFLQKWHHPEGHDLPQVEEFVISLVPHPSSFNRGLPTSNLRFQIKCTVSIEIFPRIHETVQSNNLQSRSSDDVIEELLNQLDVALSQRVKEVQDVLSAVPQPDKPILVILAGAGFSAGFGLPLTNGLRELAMRRCEDPRDHLEPLHKDRLAEYPLNEYLREDGAISDFEILLTLWEGYRHQLEQIKGWGGISHRELYRRFIERICCHLYRLSWNAEASDLHQDRFRGLADWLAQAKQRYDVRFVTFNYDVILEMLCKEAGFSFAYRERSDPSDIPIRKLHGSVNWLEFDCEVQAPNTRLDSVYESGSQYIYAFSEVEVHESPYGSSGKIPVLIAPSAGKSYRGVYEWIWSLAAQDIVAAQKVLIVGYSFPPLDVYAEYYLAKLLEKTRKPVTYILPPGKALDRVRRLMHKIEPTFICDKWEVCHFKNQTEA